MTKTILDIQNLSISFDGFKALNNVSTKIKEGSIHFFIGPNGAGKTTLLDAICGFTKPTSGKIIYNEKYDITKYKEYELVNIGIGRKFQVPSVFKSLTVYENMELAIKKNRNIFSSLFEKVTNQENQKIEEILMLIDLKEQQDMIASDLSHGQKQWLEIGMLLAQDLKLILLDEPVAGMGRRETTKTGELLKKISKHCTVIVVEHDMQFVRDYATTVTVLHEGAILDEGNVLDVQNNPKVISVYLGRGGENCA